MKSRLIIVLGVLALLVLIFAGCEQVPGTNMLKIKPPTNDELTISGTWKVESYKVLDPNMYPTSEIKDLVKKNIYISDDNLNMDSQIFKNVDYKLKVVGDNYFISYQSKYTVKNLGVKSAEVITAADKSNVISDFFYLNDSNSYVYYRGILLQVKKIEGVDSNDFIPKPGEVSINSFSVNENSSETGILLALKTPRKKIDGKYTPENYRTLWISYVNDKVKIQEAPGVIFPRMNGMWTLNKKISYENGKYKEYFVVNPFNGKQKPINLSMISGNTNIYSSINYIGNDYIGVETYKGNDFKGDYPTYKMLPIDNFYLNKGIALEDVYDKGINPIYQDAFQKEYNNLNSEQKTLVNGNVDYRDFTLVRNEGKWTIQGKISPIDDNNPSYNFQTSIKPSSNLVRYDTLVIPWRLLRADMPTIEDAYTSPDGKIAIIFIKGELLVYKVNNNKLDGKPMLRYNLNEGDKVIMDEWCSGDYINYWNNSFNQYKKDIEEEQ